jgi:hypothetical protein
MLYGVLCSPAALSSFPPVQFSLKVSRLSILEDGFSSLKSLSFRVVRITTNGEKSKSSLSVNKLGCKRAVRLSRTNCRAYVPLLGSEGRA